MGVSERLERDSCTHFEETPHQQRISDLSWGCCDCQRDEKTTAAVVKVASRDQQHTKLKRPIQLLYTLETLSQQRSRLPKNIS